MKPKRQHPNPYMGLSPAERRNFFRRTPKPTIAQYYPPKGHLTRSAPKLVERFQGYAIKKAGPGVFVSDFDPGTELETAGAWRQLIRSFDKPAPRKRRSSGGRGWRSSAEPRYNPKRGVTDRALRYRAVNTPPHGPKICCLCGSKRNVEVGHVNGHEEDTGAANLIWTCRPCNVLAGNALRRARMGRLTRQYNPTKSGGAANLAEWLLAVGAITPRKGAKYAASIGSPMSTRDAVAMIRATPPAKRSEFARAIWSHRRERGTDRSGVPF